MKLFFSYGNDENEETVMRLKRGIEEREHSVWIDKGQIKSGDDWRRTITSGILDSEFMMSFASNHSVRKPGVCLEDSVCGTVHLMEGKFLNGKPEKEDLA